MVRVKNNGKTSTYVYDVSLDHTVVNALGLNVVSNTDGFNFQLPKKHRYTKEKPYISPGLSRETKKDVAYTGFEADAAEFNDTYMRDFHYAPNAVQKMAMGIDECVDSTINFSRKNYSDYFPEEPFPNDVKMVGNTIKSKKMPEYIAKFLEKGIRLLLQKKGQEFLEEYYAYIEKIYNYKIPLRQIATKGKVKKSIPEYIKDCEVVTKAGRPKSRQAWMELAIRNNLNVGIGETIYYINTGTIKSQADVKKVTHYYQASPNALFEEKKDVRVMLEKEWKKNNIDGKLAPSGKKLDLKEYVKKHHKDVVIEDEIILNCEALPVSVVESEHDTFCEEGKEYNAPKYIDMFNKRITPLLVCFNPDIRGKILIKNPLERQYFTAEDCELCSGFPNEPGDQDTYNELMTMEDKEIKFWKEHPEWDIPYLKECGMDWDEIVSDYEERMRREEELGINRLRFSFQNLLMNAKGGDFDGLREGKLPVELSKQIAYNPEAKTFNSIEYNDIVIGTMYDVIEAQENYYENLDFGEDDN